MKRLCENFRGSPFKYGHASVYRKLHLPTISTIFRWELGSSGDWLALFSRPPTTALTSVQPDHLSLASRDPKLAKHLKEKIEKVRQNKNVEDSNDDAIGVRGNYVAVIEMLKK